MALKIPDNEISAALDVIGDEVNEIIKRVLGERMGYAMLVREKGSGPGHCMLISNGSDDRQIQALLQEGINQLDLDKTVN